MRNVVSFETARRLKEAGFKQPEYEAGQFWYSIPGYLCLITHAGERQPGFTLLNGLGREIYTLDMEDRGAIFAPTATDILREIGRNRLWKMSETPAGFGEVMKIIIDPEAAALAWLAINEKQ